MDHDAEHEGGAIHPAFQARISQVLAAREQRNRDMIGGAVLDLANAAASPRRAAASTAIPPEVARIVVSVEAALNELCAGGRVVSGLTDVDIVSLRKS